MSRLSGTGNGLLHRPALPAGLYLALLDQIPALHCIAGFRPVGVTIPGGDAVRLAGGSRSRIRPDGGAMLMHNTKPWTEREADRANLFTKLSPGHLSA